MFVCYIVVLVSICLSVGYCYCVVLMLFFGVDVSQELDTGGGVPCLFSVIKCTTA